MTALVSASSARDAAQSDLERFLHVIYAASEGVLHLRAFDGKGRRKTTLGYSDSVEWAARLALSINGEFATIAVGFNPFQAGLLSRAKNRLDGGVAAVSDADVTARRFLVVDIDAKRASGICATDTEFAAARALADVVREALAKAGFPEPIELFSGNGIQFVYRIDLPAEDGGLVKRCLEGLDFLFSNSAAHVDISLANPSRVLRLPGTLNAKGDSTPERPHRTASILSFPDTLEIVDHSVLELVAAWLPEQPTSKRKPSGGKTIDLVAFMAEHHLRAKREKDWKDAKVYILEVCPFNAEHNDDAACLIQHASGAVGFKCHHNSCTGNGWKELRALLGIAVKEGSPFRASTPDGRPPPARMRTDTGNAERLRDQAGEDLRYVEGAGHFVIWDGTRWRRVDEAIALASTKPVVRNIYTEAASASSELEPQEIRKWAAKSESLKSRTAMLKLFRSEEGMAVAVDRFDAHPNLLNFTNGTLDLDTGKLRPHSRGDWLTKRVPYAFNADAPAPRFDAFLARILRDPELREFLHRLVGNALFGAIEDHLLALLIGEGNNGKSTLVSALLDAFGSDYAMQGASSLLMKQKSPQHPTELADLFGKRLLVCSEIENAGDLDEARVKQLTGGDRIRARWMHKDFFEFEPSHTIFLAANSLPTIHGRDEGIWRRIYIVPFDEYIGPDEVDARLGAQLRAERAGIMAWALRGYRAWREQGLAAPALVREAVEQYRFKSDVVAAFLRARCRLDKEASTAAGVLESAYAAFGRSSSSRSVSWKDAQRAIEKRGVSKKRGSAGSVYHGIALLDPENGGRGDPVLGVLASKEVRTSESIEREPGDPALPAQGRVDADPASVSLSDAATAITSIAIVFESGHEQGPRDPEGV